MSYLNYEIGDGEMSLFNWNLKPKFERYVSDCIGRSNWINRKNFIDAIDIIVIVQDKYRDAGIDPKDVAVICRKLRSEVQLQWMQYLKNNDHKYYQWVMDYRKKWLQGKDKYGIRNAECYKKPEKNKQRQQKIRDEISLSYLCQLVYNDIKYKEGIALTFDEIKQDFFHLLIEKREKVLERRNKKLNL